MTQLGWSGWPREGVATGGMGWGEGVRGKEISSDCASTVSLVPRYMQAKGQ